jgi:nucleoside-diphosphate-sugar epimerase
MKASPCGVRIHARLISVTASTAHGKSTEMVDRRGTLYSWRDVAEAIVRTGTVDGVGGETFQIATSAETTVLELAKKLEEILRRNGVRARARA